MIQWTCNSFEQLAVPELYDILSLRNEVFIVEQNCPYQDLDGKDAAAWHLTAREDGQLLAYTRLLPPGLAYPEASIGRVVTAPSARKRGLGKELMTRSIALCEELFGPGTIRIGAQYYLLRFYTSLGFAPEGEIYLEDGIPHIIMTK